MLPHYLGKSDQAKYVLKLTKKPEKNIHDIIDRNLKKDKQILIIFRKKYFWHNWLLNKYFSFHLTQRLLLHYLGKADQA